MRSNYMGATATLALAASFATQADAFFRMSCPGRLVAERVDPIITPGATSSHVHTVCGGNGFDFTTDYAQQRDSTCSSCPLKDDLSAYWTPQLYFRDPKDKHFEIVPLAGSGPGVSGGMTVYYQQRGPNLTALEAFPEGFRMIAGNPFQRSPSDAEAAPGKAVSYACLDYNAPASDQTAEFPLKNCPDGLRAQVYFPSCWNGELDSPDHQSHMHYPIGEYDNGACPESHPRQLVSIFYEVLYDTSLFEHRWGPAGTQPFVWAMGDSTGYGFHGDFINGWNVDVLKDVIKDCDNDSGNISDCPHFDNRVYTNDECHACQVPPRLTERINGTDDEPLMDLPGCNQVTGNHSVVNPSASCPNTPTPGAYKTYFTDVTSSLDWAYAGCVADNIGGRTLAADFTWSFNMTVEFCVDYCKGKGYSLAGLEYADQCYCDNEYQGTAAPNSTILGNCWQPCMGDDSQVCGGAAALSVYQACNGGSCDNAVYDNPAGSRDLFTGSGNSTSTDTAVDAASVDEDSSSSASASSATVSLVSQARKQVASTTLVPSVSSSSSSSSSSVTVSTVSSDGAAVVTVTNVVTATTKTTVAATASSSAEKKHRHFLKHRNAHSQ